ncbi:uncharacterized protein EHS24_003998 [Apiotrichum porosum]|uniref:Uncharacterized protein n=1 Tax=Apiotrichum porosum TaxID=105984 RepID=A0A427Y409_9TREE|nr:uncharacterized protein EHS24_003998 [Apiotrichum porosum]RSH85818.1 hypothetical protein EHS24_003998 [Apiotrichum porosum]
MRPPSPPRLLLLIALALVALLPLAQAKFWSDSLSYCKCICFTNSSSIPLYMPDDPSKPCLSCTRQFCLDQKLAICKGAQVPELDTDVGTGTEGDVEARCFKRDSPRDQAIVTLFVLTVCGLLLYAGVRSKLRKAIEDRGQPTDLREWGAALLPTSLIEYTRAHEMRGGNSLYQQVTRDNNGH